MGSADLLPDAIPLQALTAQQRTLPPDAFKKQFGSAFLVAVSGGLGRPRPMQRTVTSEEAPDEVTGETMMMVLPLRSKKTESGIISIGRAASCDVMVNDTTVSKVHAFFRVAGGGYTVTDAGSHNGTTVGTVRVAVRGQGEPSAVKPMDTVIIGAVSFVFVDAAALQGMMRKLPRFDTR